MIRSTTLLLFFVQFAFVFNASAQDGAIPRSYIAYKANGEISIDGKADEPSWKSAMFSQSFIDIEGKKKPKYNTQMKMLWDDAYLYIFAEMEEPHIWGNLTQRDTVIFYNNDFEVFIDPDGDTHNYYELEVNSLNTQWDLFLTKPYRNGGKVLDSWDIQGLKTAVNVVGTLNNPSDKDTSWSIEIAIPWSVITEAANHGKPPKNEYWRINFSRVNWDFDLINERYSRKKDSSGKYLPEYNWVWSPQGVINMHEPERWGYVFFSDNKSNSDSDFEIPKDEHIKWKLYHWYRKLHLNNDAELPKFITVFDEQIAIHLEKNLVGWHLWCQSPFTGAQLIIEHDGKFLQKE